MSVEDLGKKPISVGPWGGQGGNKFDDGVYTGVKQLIIAHGAGIDSIQIEYDNKGSSIWSPKHGGSGGNKTDKVKLDYPSEYLISISGCYGSLTQWGSVFIRSLTLKSNKKIYGPYGNEFGTQFSLPMSGGKIVGFHGKCGWYLDSIGVYLKSFDQTPNPQRPLAQPQNYVANVNDKVGYSIIQGSVGQNYDIVLALRQKDDSGNTLPAKHPNKGSSSSSSSSSSDSESEEKDEKGTKRKVPPQKPNTAIIPTKLEGLKCCGPFGGNGGVVFDDGENTGIRQIRVSRNVGVVSIKVQYDRNGQAVWGSKHGGTGGFKVERIMFDYPSEILTHITGTYGSLMYMGPTIIRSITFHTNIGKHGPYGEEQGPSFTTKPVEGKIVGFLGREGLFLDAIGVYVKECIVPPATTHPLSNALVPKEMGPVAQIENPSWSNKLVAAKQVPAEEVALGVVKEPCPIGPGPWGGDGGRPWDDGVYSGIRQIFVTRGEAVCSIQIEYDRSGQSLWAAKHGGNGGTVTHRVKLEFPHEVLNCVSGYYGEIGGESMKVIKSLTFYTSRGKYGPFGEEKGTYFTSPKTDGKVVGFHGRSSMYLDAIGVHMQHWLGSNKTSKHSLFRIFI